MNSILAPRPDDRPPEHEKWGTGVTISVIAHLSLVGALVWGLHWRSSPVEAVASAELWSAIPEIAAPPPVEAPPPPPPAPAPPPVEAPKPPDIVVEKIPEPKKPEKPKPEPPKPVKVEPPKPAPPPPPPKDKLDAKQLAKLHAENMKRMMGQMDAPVNATGTAAHDSGPSAGYGGRIIARLRPKLVLTDSIPGNPEVIVTIHCAPDGTIIGRKITKSSGSSAWDDAVIRAIDRTGILPRDTDGRVPDPIELSWHPLD